MSWSDTNTEIAVSSRSSFATSQGSTIVQDAISIAESQASSPTIHVIDFSSITPETVYQEPQPAKKTALSSKLPRSSLLTTWKRQWPRSIADFVASGNLAKAKALIKDGASVNELDGSGHTPLYNALVGGFFGIAKLLLKSGACVVDPTNDDCVTSLVTVGDRGDCKLHHSVYYRMVPAPLAGYLVFPSKTDQDFCPILRFLYEHGGNVVHGYEGRTPFIEAAQHGHESVTRLLLDMGANPHANDYEVGRTPLIWAIVGDHYATCEALLTAGASCLQADSSDTTPLIYAAKANNPEICKILLRHGAEVDSLDSLNQTALIHATSRCHTAVCHLLLASGANAGTVPKSPTTALHEATFRGQISTIRRYLDAGTDANVRNQVGLTPLHVAAIQDQVAAAKLLLDEGADVNAESPGKRMPLTFAVAAYNVVMVDLLLERGADPHAEDRAGWSPWRDVLMGGAMVGREQMWQIGRMRRMRELMEVA